jgi:hypothetical protein
MKTEFERITEAYLTMASEVLYRPAMPSDGFGNTGLSESELNDPLRLQVEAGQYSKQFIAEENQGSFHIGVSDYATNRALVYVIEAARLLCAGQSRRARQLLELAITEIDRQADRD